MITAEGCRGRRQRLWERLGETVEAVLIASPEHLAYLAGYAPSPFSFRSNESWAALWMAPDEAVLIADNVCRPFAEAAHVDRLELIGWYDGKHTASGRRAVMREAVARFVGSRRPRRLGVEWSAVPAGVLAGPDLEGELTDVGPTLLELRRQKDPDELATLELAISAAEAGFAAAMEAIRPGITELELYLRVNSACTAALDTPAQIYGDFAAGARAKGPDTHATPHALREGELWILDFSVVVRGYRCDFANTLVAGEPSADQRALMEACQAALERGEERLGPGVEARTIDEVVQAEIAARGWTTTKRSHTGHGLGLSHPEAPYLVAESRDVLRVGDVVTIEPSVFPPDWAGGIRIEHNYVITEGGCRRLTHHRIGLTR
ncbi:MAG: putative peptidase YqhT [Isosphaeraceae bacterium]|nr:MAG: putative peptidase YqhT [Isosphaeraceae bacterium]